MSSDSSISNKIELISKRNYDRKLELEKRQQEKNETTSREETLEYFTNTFEKQQKTIEHLLKQSNGIERKELSIHFDKISKEILNLQKYLSNSVKFLPSYDVKKFQEYINLLNDNARELEQLLLPKKKFAFKTKKTTIDVKNNDEIDSDSAAAKATAIPAVDSLSSRDTLFSKEDEICGFRDRSNEILTMDREEFDKKDVLIENLIECHVKLLGSPSTLHLNNMKNCYVFTGPVSTSIFVSNCENCVFVIACQQLRLHNSLDLKIYLHVTSRAIMEDCDRIFLAQYNLQYSDLLKDFHRAGLDITLNHWHTIDDFNWLNQAEQSPHWTIMKRAELVENWDNYLY